MIIVLASITYVIFILTDQDQFFPSHWFSFSVIKSLMTYVLHSYAQFHISLILIPNNCNKL